MMATAARLVDLVPVPYQPRRPHAIAPARGYAVALAFYLLAFGVFAATAILDGAAAWGFHPGWSAWAYRWAGLGLWGTLTVLVLWLASTQACRLVWLLATGVVVCIAGDAAVTGGAMRTPDGIYELCAAGTATVLAVVFARRRGVPVGEFGIGRGWGQREFAGRRQAFCVYWWAVAGSGLSDVIAMAIMALGLPHGHSPIRPHENPLGVMLRIVSAGVTEEVIVAIVVIALTAARRSAWEMYALSVTMRVSYHMYYQAAGLSVLAMGVMYVWLYRRTRRLTPIICAHIVTDVIAWAHQAGLVWTLGASAASCLGFVLADTHWAKTPEEGPEAAAAEQVTASEEPLR